MLFKLLPLLAVVMGVLLVSCSSKEGASTQAPAAAPQKLPVDIQVVKATPLNLEEVIVGTIDSYKEVDIVSELLKRITKIGFKDGSYVQQGQLLYQLDDADLKAQLKRLESELKLAKINESRLAKLLITETIRQEEYDIALTKLQTLEAEAELLQVSLAKTEIRAPFGGQVGISKVHVGSLVSPAVPLVTLQDQSQVKLRFLVPEKYLNLVKTGNKVTFSTEGQTEKYAAVITATEPNIDEQNRSILVQATVNNAKKLFKTGQSARIYFPITKQQATGITLPTEALIPGASGYTVFVVKNGTAHATPVTISNRSETKALITAGLNDGDTVMISNILRAGDGTPVQVISMN